jgi:LmbE family N-acetylglucosaminyl deacetylase
LPITKIIEVNDLTKKIVVFAPHPDDETLGCGGTIARRLSEGCEVFVYVITDGRFSFSVVLGIDSDPSPEELRVIRRNETMRATKIIGLPESNLFFLDFEDNALLKHEEELEQKVMEVLKKYNPDEVFFTYGKDYNYDHQATSRAVKRCIKKLDSPPVAYQYSIARPGTCGIYGRVRPLMDAIINIFQETTVKIAIHDFLPLKEKAVHEFKSEISLLSPKQTRPITVDPEHFLKSKETFFTT